MPRDLTQRQAEIYTFIVEFLEENQYPPTVREIAEHFGIKSSNGAWDHIKKLINKGYLTRESNKSRALRPVVFDGFTPISVNIDKDADKEEPTQDEECFASNDSNKTNNSTLTQSQNVIEFNFEHIPPLPQRQLSQLKGVANVREIPVLGRIAAGVPIPAFEDIEEILAMDASLFCHGMDDVFALRVRGNSMIGDGILPGDLVFVRPQATAEQDELIAALVDGDATVKRYKRIQNNVFLMPSNPEMDPIIIPESEQHDFKILGSIRGVLRQYP